ncbi:GMP synthase [glutamine-hydrolyzing] subunit A [Striga asiatica]|uniref:GMP synthase [glutamine-hydrolyzing] subunit A n=1 Tax=Striga asiatica TaxID=4170 RepID=A0A5A7RD99_STRAF|nr:GMP synthase [glutamine-hydrolyzing] subunit A [Striga asiatica]
MGGQKFAVLLCADDSDYVKKIYGGYFGVFVRMLREEGEEWDVFRVARGEFPDDGDIAAYDGFVITGSCNDAHGNDLWVCRLLILLNRLDAMKKKVLGICFGHQILGRALGGKIGRASGGWDIGITKVHLFPSPIFTSLHMPDSLSVIECHRDEVWELPAKAEVLAWSDKTGVEMFRYGSHIMGIQGHPEYTKDILSNLIDRLLNRELIEEETAEEAKSKMEGGEPDREAWKKLCTGFLKGKL